MTTVYIAGIYEYAGGANTRYYVGEMGVVAMRRTSYGSGNGIFYLLSDQLNSTSRIVNSAGTIQSTQYYYPFGGNRGGAFSTLTTKRFTGQYHESSLPGGEGLSYYNARWYDAKLGRFISADTIVPSAGNPQTFNRYAYVVNNPVKFRDETGHDPIDTTWQAEFERIHDRKPTPEDVLIRLYSIAFPGQWNWSVFYNQDGSYIEGSLHAVFENTKLRSWENIPSALSSMSGWYSAEEGKELTRDIGALFGGLLNRLEQPNTWAAVRFPSNPARVWVRVGTTGLPSSLLGNDEDGNIHHWGWAVAIGGSWFHAGGEGMNSGREVLQLRVDQIVHPPDDFFADVSIGNAGVVFGRRVRQNGGATIRQDFQEVMGYWAGYFQRVGGQ